MSGVIYDRVALIGLGLIGLGQVWFEVARRVGGRSGESPASPA